MSEDNANKKRKSKWTTSYSNMSIEDAEERLGVTMSSIRGNSIAVEDMLVQCAYAVEDISKSKEKVYDHILEHLEMEGYPGEEDPDFKESNVNDLVHYIIGPIISDFRRKTGRNIRLRREKEIVAVDSETGGYEEFVVMDVIAIKEKKFVLIVESKRSSLGHAMKQCLLAMEDMRGNNGGVGEIYGFVTTGETWRMIRYDGTSFKMTRKIEVVFEGMDQEKELWMKHYSVLVDCMYAALSYEGIAKKDVVVV